MADTPPPRPDTPPPPRPPEQSPKPTPEFQQKLDDVRALKETRQDAGQSVDNRAAKVDNAPAREGAAQRSDPVQPSRGAEGDRAEPRQRAGEGDRAEPQQRVADGDRADPRQRAADGAGGETPQRGADVSRGKDGAAPNEPAGLRPTPEFQQKLDDVRAQKEAKQDAGQATDRPATKAENQQPKAEESPSQQRPADAGKPQSTPEPAADRQAAAAEQTSPQRPETRPEEQPESADDDRDQPVPPANDLGGAGADRDVPRAVTDDPPRPGDRGFDPGLNHGELRDDFRPGTHDPDGRFNAKERRIADRLAEDGASVHARERDDTTDNKKNPDSMVRTSPEDPGTVTEFKTLNSASSGAVRYNILKAAKQVDQYGGGDAVVDGRAVNLTSEDARRGYARAVGQAKDMNLAMPDRVMIIMGDGSIKVFPEV